MGAVTTTQADTERPAPASAETIDLPRSLDDSGVASVLTEALAEHIARRREQPHFANARSIRNALDRARLRQANRLFEQAAPVRAADLSTIEAEDIRASRVFGDERHGEEARL